MAESRTGRRVRRVALWALTAALAGYALTDDDDSGEAKVPERVAPVDDGKLRVVEIDPLEAHPGDAIFVRVGGARDIAAVHVLVSTRDKSKEPVEVIHRKASQLVVQLPTEVALGIAKLRAVEGDRRSKPFEFRIEPVSRRKQVRNVIGGLALFVFGLRTLSRGLRSWAGPRVRGFLGKLTGGSPRSVALGALVGGVTQLTTTASGLVVGLLEPRLVSLGAAIGVIIGAQLGASAMVAVLPLASAREGLLVLAMGVAWISFAGDRRSKALGNVILGLGLLFFGLHRLRVGFEPMVADPQVLPYLGVLASGGFGGYAACVASGIVLAALLQGPAPVFVLVLGITQATGAIDLPHSLAILSGTGLGAAIATTVVAWPFGRNARRLAMAHALIGALVAVAVLAGLPLWIWLADAVMSGDPQKVAYGKKILLPNMDEHLAAAYVASQLAAAALATAALQRVLRLVRRAIPPRPVDGSPAAQLWSGARGAEEGATVLSRRGLVRALGHQRDALGSAFELCRFGERSHGTESEHSLADARAELEEMFRNLVGPKDRGPELEALRRAALAVLQLQRSIEDFLRLAERGVESNVLLTEGREREDIDKANRLVNEGLDALVQAIESGEAPDVEAAREREIRLNAHESAGRHKLLAPVDVEPREARARIRATELLDAYENVGNRLYRVFEALDSDLDDAMG